MNKITEKQVENAITFVETFTSGKTTIVKAILYNGFEIVESSSCVDTSNYDVNIGKEICLEKIKDKIWELLGFLLQEELHQKEKLNHARKIIE